MSYEKHREIFATRMGLPESSRRKHDPSETRRIAEEIMRQPDNQHSWDEAYGRALARQDAQAIQREKAKTLVSSPKTYSGRVNLVIIGLLILICLLLAHKAYGQGSTVIRGAAAGTTPANNATVTSVDANHKALDVNIAAGGGTGGGPSDAAPNAAASESDTARQKITTVLRLLDASLGAGVQMVTAKGTQAGGLWVECKVGCAGGATTPSDAFANPTTAGLQATFNMLYNGLTWDRWRGDTTSGAWVNVKNATIAVTQSTSPWVISFTAPQHVIIDSGATAATQSGTWSIRIQDGAGNALTSNSTTYTAKFALDGNLLGTLGTAFTTPGKVDVKSAAGDLNATLAAETTKVIGTARIIGNGGATLDAATSQNVAPPTNGLMILCEFNTTPTTITTGNASPCQLDSAGNLIVNLKTALPAGSALIGKVGIDQTTNGTTNAVNPIPATTGGLSTSYVPAAATTNATSVKNAAGQVYHISVSNTTATLYYLRMYNLAAAPTCSSATGFVETIPIPASTSGGGREREMVMGQAFGTGIAYCITGGATSTDNTAAAVGVHVTVLYK